MPASNPSSPPPPSGPPRLAAPPSSAPCRGLLHGREITIFFDRQKPVEWYPHSHDHFQIALLFESANCELRWWDKSEQLHSRRLAGKEAWFIPPGIKHAADWRAEAYLLVLYVPERFLQRVSEKARSAVLVDGPGSFIHHDPVVWTLAATVRFLCDEQGGPDMDCLESLSMALVLRLLAAHGTGETGGARGKLSRERVLRVSRHVQAHIGEPIRITALARLVGLCTGHFSEVFKRATGLTPSAFVLQLRLMRAQELIIGGADRLSEVADAAGFSDQSHLTRSFRKAYGITPKMLLEKTKAAKHAKKTEAGSRPAR